MKDFPDFWTEEEIARLRSMPKDDPSGIEVDEVYEDRRKIFYRGRKIEGTLLTVLGSRGSGRGPEVICQCACGKVVAYRYRTLYFGGVYSCGCAVLPMKTIGRKPVMDLTGMEFGRFMVMEYKGAFGWEVLCQECQELETIAPKAGRTYVMLLTQEGNRPCKVKAERDAHKPEWRVQIETDRVRGVVDSRSVTVRADNPVEAREEAKKRLLETEHVAKVVRL